MQTVVLSRIELWGARPNLMLLVVLIWAIVRDVEEGVLFAFIGGVIIDLFSGGPLGATVLGLLAVAFLAGQQWGRGVGSPLVLLWLSVLVSVLAYHLILLGVLSWTGHPVSWAGGLLRVAGPSALLNAALAPFVRQPLEWVERRTRRERSFVL